MIYLHTLGDTLIKVDEKEIRPTAPLIFGALLYLGMERGRRVPRAALQELFFPKADERSGAHSVRQLLYKLRQLGVPVGASADDLSLCPECVTDDSATVADCADLARLRGGILPGYFPAFSETFSEWLEDRRAGITADIRRKLVAELTAARAGARWQEVDRLARTLLVIDPLNEEATLALAEATASAGAKEEAVAILRRYERDTSETLRVPAQLLRERISKRSYPTSRLATPFVGREEEVARLLEHLRQRLRGPGGIVALTGDPGIGKSRLIEQALNALALDDVAIHTVRCKPHYFSRPFGAVIDIAAALSQTRGALGVTPESLDTLRHLVRSDWTSDNGFGALDDITRSRLIIKAFRDLVDAVAAEQQLVIAVEDIHWMDLDSLRELSVLPPAIENVIAILLTARHLEQEAKGILVEHDAVFVRMPPLSLSAMTTLAERQLSSRQEARVEDHIVSWYAKRATGNPLFLQMLCAHYEATREAFLLPDDLVTATTNRIDQLSPNCRRLLELAGVLGRHATIEMLRKTTAYTSVQLLDAIQRLESHGFITLSGEHLTVHDLVADCVVTSTGAATRAVLHDLVARHLEEKYASTHDASVLWDCAEHWKLSGNTPKSVEFIRHCARHLVDIGRARQALDLLGRAEEVAPTDDVRAAIAAEIMLTSRAAHAWFELFEASERYKRYRHGTGCDHDEIELLIIEAAFQYQDEGAFAIPQLMKCASCSASHDHRIQATDLILRIAHESGMPSWAHEAFTHVQPILPPTPESYEQWMVLLIYHTSFGDPNTAANLARDLDSIVPYWPLAWRLRGYLNVGTACSHLGMHERSIATFARVFDEAALRGLREWEFGAAAAAAWEVLCDEDVVEAEKWINQCRDILARAAPGRISHARLVAAECELGILKGDNALAGEKLLEFMALPSIDSARARYFCTGASYRIKLLNPDYKCGADDLEILRTSLNLAHQLQGGETIIGAYVEALIRAQDLTAAREALQNYMATSRRKFSPLPPSLHQMADALGLEYSPGYITT